MFGTRRRFDPELERDPTSAQTPPPTPSQDDSDPDVQISKLDLVMRNGADELPARFGEVEFSTRLPDRPLPKFACISDQASPEAVVDMLRVWLPEPPNVIISVTGSAQRMNLDHELEALIMQGLASGAKSTNAWIIDGGTDSGVMRMVGDAFESAKGEVPLIGVVPWRMTTHRDIFFNAADEEQKAKEAAEKKAEAARKRLRHIIHGADSDDPSTAPPPPVGHAGAPVRYVKRLANSSASSSIDINHTHFLFVDNGEEKWGGEVATRAVVEKTIRTRLKVPGVLLVVQGGLGTYKTVLAQIKHDNPVLLVKETDGCAKILSDFVAELDNAAIGEKNKGDGMWRRLVKRLAPAFRDRLPKEDQDFYDDFVEIAEKRPLLHVYSALDQKRSSFEMMLLTAFVSAYRRNELEDLRLVALRSRIKQLQLIEGSPVPPHVNARSQHNPKYPDRFQVPDGKVKWTTEWAEYEPTAYTDKSVIDNERGKGGGWADPPDVESILPELRTRKTYYLSGGFMRRGTDSVHDVIAFDPRTYMPRNPRGRTGIVGRGLLGKWGPNHAADPIVTRWHTDDVPPRRRLQMVAVKRKDNGQWAIPGGMVDAGEDVPVTLRREFKEEACAFETGSYEKELTDALVDELFANGRCIYSGYVDDPRNTDNSWMETVAMHFHCSDALGQRLNLKGGDDAAKATWLDIDPLYEPRYANLYASHRDWVDRIAERLRDYNATSSNDYYPLRTEQVYPDRQWEIEPEVYQCDRVEDTPGGWNERELEQMKKRGSFESPIDFRARPDERGGDEKPHNPVGRTGVRGRGVLKHYGPNHEVHTIVTRFDPGHRHRLQVAVLAHHIEQPSQSSMPFLEKEPMVQLPSGPLEESEEMFASASTASWEAEGFKQSKVLEARMEAARRIFEHPSGVPESRQLHRPPVDSHVHDEIFRTGAPGVVVYAGYMDDARNTDNAWVETCVVHFHCSHELGGKLAYEPYGRARDLFGKTRDTTHHSKLCWMDASIPHSSGVDRLLLVDGEKREQLRDAEVGWVDQAIELLLQRQQPGLLQLVARWGRRDVLAAILADPENLDYCQLDKVQAAFKEALGYATHPNFDVSVIDLLLNHGAKPADLWGPGLFEDGSLSVHGGLNDAFGLVRQLREQSEKKKELEISASPGDLAVKDEKSVKSSVSDEVSLRDEGAGAVHGTARAFRRRSIAMPDLPAGDLSPGRKVGAQQTSPRKPLRALRAIVGKNESAHSTSSALSSWPASPSRDFLDKLMPGFAFYADSQPVIRSVDLAFWALTCGSYDLAKCMWARCQSPMRAALLLHAMCVTIRTQNQKFEGRVTHFEECFGAMANGILDHIGDHDGENVVDDARKVLLSKAGAYTHLGSRKGALLSCMDLAITFKNKEFLSHRNFQSVVDDMWCGRSSFAGHLRVKVQHKRGDVPFALLVLQVILPFAPVLHLEKNDLFDPQAMPLLHALRWLPTPVYRMFGVCCIPMVKRLFSTLSRAAFFMLFSYIALLKPCGQLHTVHWVGGIWTCSLAIEELYQMVTNLGSRNKERILIKLDFLTIALLIAVFYLRMFVTVEPRESTAVDLIDYVNQLTSDRVREDVTFASLSTGATHGDLNFVPADVALCSWSLELELLRTLTALSALLLSVRMLTSFDLLYETGVLMITSLAMLVRMLEWLPLVLILSFGFAIAMNVLAPYYRLEHSPGPLRLPIEDFTGDFSAGGPFFSPFWAIYGYVEPGALALGHGSAVFAPVFMWSYLMLSLILFVNLLIAVFNDAYATVQAEKSQYWKMSRVFLVKSHMEELPLPPPFNLIVLIFDPLRALWTWVRGQLQSSSSGDDDKGPGGAKGSKSTAKVTPGSSTPARPSLPKSATKVSKAMAKEALEAEEIERRARTRLLRLQPRFEETAGSSKKDQSRLFTRLQEVRDYTESSSSTLESRLGLLEISQNHYADGLKDQLRELQEAVERGFAGGTARYGGAGADGVDPRSRQVFLEYDKNNSGDISFLELKGALKKLGLRTTRNEIMAIQKRYDTNQDGTIDLAEFNELVLDVRDFQRAHRKSSRIFEKHDVDGSGTLTRNELRSALLELGFDEARMEDHVERVLKKYDFNDDRGIDLDEFTRLVGDLQKPSAPAAAAPVAAEPTRAPAPAQPVQTVQAGEVVMAKPEWFDEKPPWWEISEQERRHYAKELKDAMHNQVSTLTHQSSSLARVTNHLAQEVSRLRPEYWQRAHYATMSGPHSILEPTHPSLRPKGQRPTTMPLAMPMVEGSPSRGYSGIAQGGLAGLPSDHPIAHAHDHKQLQRVFAEFDYDHDGSLDAGELRGALSALGLNADSTQAARVLRTYDADQSGRIEYGEFRSLAAEIARFKSAPLATDEVQRSFAAHDRDGNGKIDVHELELALKDLGLKADTYQAAQILTKYDVDHSGGLELDEFRRLVDELRRFQGKAGGNDEVSRIFKRFDVDVSGTIDAAELRTALRALDISANDSQTVEVLRRYDAKGSGSLSMDEFRSLVGELRRFQLNSGIQRKPRETRSAGLTVGSADFWRSVEDTFRQFDRDGSGDIDHKELEEALNALGLRTTSQQAKQVLARYDTRGAGALDRAGFRALVAELRAFEVGGDRRSQLDRPAYSDPPPPPPLPAPLSPGINAPARSQTQSRGGMQILGPMDRR